jgi:hypothetical protein
VENAIQNIGRRRWDVLSSRWRDYLPDVIAKMPKAYEAPAKDELVLERMRSIGSLNQFETIDDAPKIRTLIFEAGRFSVERCIYFTRTAEQLAAQGVPTAALTASYLGMMFGSRAMQSLLGIYYCFNQNSTWMIDVWSAASDATNQGRVIEWTPRILALVSNRRIGHEHHWKIFMRLRSVTTRLPVDDAAIGVLRRLQDHVNFSVRRNDVQYNDQWPYYDLYERFFERLNGLDIGVLPERFDVTGNDKDYDLKAAQIFMYCAVAMLLDVLWPLPKFRSYCIQLKERLSAEWHPLINAGALAKDVAALAKL